MKNIYYFFTGCFLISLMASCQGGNFLDATETTDLEEETVFADSAYATQFLTDIYYAIGFSSNASRFGNGGLDAASDEAEPGASSSITTSLQFATGTVNPSIVSGDAWYKPYQNIRKVNKLLHHLPNVPIGDIRKRGMAAEARFLRAWYYSILLKHYGGVPILGDTVYGKDDEISFERSTYAETVDYIVAELDSVAENLPIRPTGSQYGRAGAGASLALKARVLLYAASPLFNGENIDPQNPLTGYTDYSEERWEKAADAAKAVMDLGEYNLHEDNTTEPGYGFYELFTLRTDDEYILQRMQDRNQELEDFWQPPSRGGGHGGGYPYQELVDAFGMSNGKFITDAGSGYDENDPYADRDPRFYHTIIHDQSLLVKKGEAVDVPVDIYLLPDGSPSSNDAVHTGTPTGYYVNKMLDKGVKANDIFDSDRSRPLMRYAEVLLNFAEAQNEYAGPTAEVYDAVEAVRERAGLSPFELDPGLTKEEMREVIQNERRVELAFEEHRFWDVRRWRIAEETQDKMMHGMEVVRDGSEAEYNIFDVRRHVFHDAMYLWPIPQTEVDRSEGALQQNPKW